jgi:iron uptake system component EfeO
MLLIIRMGTMAHTARSRLAQGLLAIGAIVVAGACNNPPPATLDATPQQQASDAVQALVVTHVTALHAAAVRLQADAPAADADGWDRTHDAAAVDAMKADWADARAHYEQVEGAIAVLFPELDVSTDARYDAFLEHGADADPFDGEGVTGVHAIERILWSDEIPAAVVEFESAIPGYAPAAFPQTEAQARSFKTQLCQRLVDDTQAMLDSTAHLQLDEQAAYRGVAGSMQEQVEKITLAAQGQDESHYARNTLADMRNNLAGGRAIFAAFSPWFASVHDDVTVTSVHAGFDRVQAAYDALPGTDAPAVPDGWNPDAPTAEQRATPYGTLFTLLTSESDPANASSLVADMLVGADHLGIPRLAP